jgi:hypothetical protein
MGCVCCGEGAEHRVEERSRVEELGMTYDRA